MSILQRIKTATAAGMMAVWEIGGFARFEVGKGLSGYHAFRYSCSRLIIHHSGMTAREAANLVAGWINEVKD